MSFEHFGKVSYTAETKAADFVTYLEQGKVMATKCSHCGAVYFPPRIDCQRCLQSSMDWFEVKGNGKLTTYTKVNYGPTGFEDDTPYILAIGEFEDGIKILSHISSSINESDIKVGMGLKVVPIRLPDNRIAHEFRQS